MKRAAENVMLVRIVNVSGESFDPFLTEMIVIYQNNQYPDTENLECQND